MNNRKVLTIALVIVIALSIAAGIFFYYESLKKPEEEEEDTYAKFYSDGKAVVDVGEIVKAKENFDNNIDTGYTGRGVKHDPLVGNPHQIVYATIKNAAENGEDPAGLFKIEYWSEPGAVSFWKNVMSYAGKVAYEQHNNNIKLPSYDDILYSMLHRKEGIKDTNAAVKLFKDVRLNIILPYNLSMDDVVYSTIKYDNAIADITGGKPTVINPDGRGARTY